MIFHVNYDNCHEFGLLYADQFRLRRREFVERQSYDVRVYNGMEFDQYDNPASAYLIYSVDKRTALAVSRLTPTTENCMLADLWPNAVEDKNLLNNPKVWEGTRYCIDRRIPNGMRQKIISEMAAAYLEFGLLMSIEKIIGFMPTYIYRSVFERPGINVSCLGDIQRVDRLKVRAVSMEVKIDQLIKVRLKNNIRGTVLASTQNPAWSTYGQAA